MSAKPSILPGLKADADSPFRLDDESAFQTWKQRKLELRSALDASSVYHLDPSAGIDDRLALDLGRQLDAFNFILFDAGAELSRTEFLQLNRNLGLHRVDRNPGAEADAVTLLQRLGPEDSRASYIPYTDRAMKWHTDGYYNSPERGIQAFSLFCASPAAEGGGNFLLDHELVYLQIRDTAPNLLSALMAPDMMRVPANELDDSVTRGEQSAPVFAIDPVSGRLLMRYSSRPRHLVWKDDPVSRRALNLLREVLHDGDAIVELTLEPGQGLCCNNILHGRHAYQDSSDQQRLFYRARYLDSIRPGVA